MEQPLLLDACFRAIGKCRYEMQDFIDFSAWFNGQLAPLLHGRSTSPSVDHLGLRVCRARAAWLLGEFAEVLDRPTRVVALNMLVPMVEPSSGDLYLCLTAAQSLQYLVDDTGLSTAKNQGRDYPTLTLSCDLSLWSTPGFVPGDLDRLLQQSFAHLFKLMYACSELESRTQILDTAALIVKR